MKNKQFTCPVSMTVTEKQFMVFLKQPLINLGYQLKSLYFTDSQIIATNYNGVNNYVTNLNDSCKEDYNRYFIDHYKPELFLALASLTSESAETKEEVLARFEKGVERELIGYRFKNDDFNRMVTMYYMFKNPFSLKADNTHFCKGSSVSKALIELNLLETFCDPVYKEVEKVSISTAEKLSGLSKREYFSGIALQGLISARTEQAAIGNQGIEIDELTILAVCFADSILERLDTKKTPII